MLGSKEGPALGGHQRNMHRGRPPLVQVTCTSQDGAKEEVHVVPLAMAFIDNWTVGDLLQDLQLRIKHEVVNLQLQCNDGIGGHLYEEDLLETVLQDGDELICSLTDEGEHGAAQTLVGVGSGRSVRRVREGKRGQRRQVFGDSVKVKEEVYVESKPPTPQQELDILVLHQDLLSALTSERGGTAHGHRQPRDLKGNMATNLTLMWQVSVHGHHA